MLCGLPSPAFHLYLALPPFFPLSSFQDLSLCKPEAGRSLLTSASLSHPLALSLCAPFPTSFPSLNLFLPQAYHSHPSISLPLSIFPYPFPPLGKTSAFFWYPSGRKSNRSWWHSGACDPQKNTLEHTLKDLSVSCQKPEAPLGKLFGNRNKSNNLYYQSLQNLNIIQFI